MYVCMYVRHVRMYVLYAYKYLHTAAGNVAFGKSSTSYRPIRSKPQKDKPPIPPFKEPFKGTPAA